ncbi:hypothetical protein ACFFQW_48055 [Umezawaea endophytica]|uniref:Uncharacterized protein n=1 Tax=Umezawaea endophytica TaxID=1654476 RepID=A0A9X2VKZ8_9PSEU|nr:hypothetical protein [Umezawaea endophytica]MCS7477982.1 hypothetical protein [Umezawaea endophytica]
MPDEQPPFTFSRRGELSGTGLRELVTAVNAASEHPMRCLSRPHLVEVLVRFHYGTTPPSR